MLIVDNVEERQRIGDTIRQARKNKKITQTQLGAEIGVGKVAIANYESGKIKVIPFEKRVKLAAILDIPLSALLYEGEKSTDRSCRDAVQQYVNTVGIMDEKDIDNIASILKITPAAQFRTQLLEVSALYPLGQAVQVILTEIEKNDKHYSDIELLQTALMQLFSARGLTDADAKSLASYFGDIYIKSFL